MKEQTLFKAVGFIDEDLISEAAEYMPSKTAKNRNDVEAAYVSAVRVKGARRQMWKYSVTAAALLVVAGGSMFIVNYNDGLKNNLEFPSQISNSEEQTEEIEKTAETEQETEISDTEKPTEEVKTIVPLKVECLADFDFGFFRYSTAVYVDSDPEIPQMSYSEEYFTEMTTKELLDYYDYYNNLKYWIDSNQVVEITDENTRHGIYTLPDGSVYDINIFTFETTENSLYAANRFTVTLGKKTRFGQEYIDYFRKVSEGKGDLYNSGDNAVLYNEETDTFFSVFKFFGMSIMISGTTDEITNSFFAGDPETTKYGWNCSTDSSKALICAEMLDTTAANFRVYGHHTHYFDTDVKLWYRSEDNSYLDEETFEWIPAEEWDFD